MNTKLSILCDKFIEAGWLGALILTPLYMNIYTHRMFEPDKATMVRCLALLMLTFYITKVVDNLLTKYRAVETIPPQDKPNIVLHFIKNPLFISFGAFVFAYIVSVIFSAVPYNSLWGGYDRMQGLYTSAGYWVIFLMVALNLRTKEQINRIITTIIFTSLIITIYAFIQRLRLDPVPWQAMDPSIRASATMGNPIFLGAYMIMAIPLTLARFIQAIIEKKLSLIFYGIAILLQIITVFLTRGVGSLLAITIGLTAFFVFLTFARRNILLLIPSVVILLCGILYLAVTYAPSLISIDKSANGSFTVTTKPQTSARTKEILWKGVWKLITDKDEPHRFFIGYGPESLSTVYYKNYTMELAKLEGANVHADRSHNGFLDIWVWHGLFGLIAFLGILISAFYLFIRTLFIQKGPDGALLSILAIGVSGAIISHLMEVVNNIATASTLTHFWILIAVIYTIYRLKLFPQPEEPTPEVNPTEPQANETQTDETPAFVTVYSTHDPSEISIIRLKLQDSGIPFVIQNENTQNMLPGVDGFVQAQIQVLQNDFDNAKLLLQGIVKDANQIQSPPVLNIPDTFNWKIYLFIGYAVLTVVIAFIMFYISWPEATWLTPEIKKTRDTMLAIFCLWLLAGIIVGIIAWPRWLFWTYAEQTIILAVIMVKKYWPDDTTDTDLLMIYSWVWLLSGLIIGALSIRDNRKATLLGQPEGIMAGIVTLAAAGFIIVTVNLPVLRADGFYKFCFSYDQSAEESMRQGKKDEAYQIRLACIRFFQDALRFAPDERAYLNGAGRNFLELAKLSMDRIRKNDTNPPNQLKTMPSIKELVEGDFIKRDASNRWYTDYNYYDFAVLSYACIQRAYELDPKNYERLIALIRISRYMGDMTRDKTFFEKALKLCDEARKASPLNTKTDDEIKELQQRLLSFPK